jgi:sulfur carrier protein
MKISVNGNPVSVPGGSSVRDLLVQLGLKPGAVAVERNLHLVPRAEHDATVLAEGDRVEVVTLVGGG